MIAWLRTRPLFAALAGFLAGALLIGLIWAISAAALGGSRDGDALEPRPTPGRTETPDGAGPATPSAVPSVAPMTDCPDATVSVSDADELQSALDAASPGDVIEILPGRYVGEFVATNSGEEGRLITLCGSEASILDGDNPRGGYVLHLDGARYWHLLGFTVTNGQKGVMADTTVGSIIEGLTVTGIGDEAIHLRNFSTDNVVIGNTISVTGLRREKFGEGVYIGTAESNWCTITDCRPDESDRNVVEGNVISDVTAEAVDVKEGTTGGIVRNNTFDGSGMTEEGADSWVDIKGNDWLIEGNVGTDSLLDGFQTHEILDGWGTRNTFRGNTANVNGPGFGYSLTPVRDNVVTCDNTASNAGEGVANVDCSG